MAWPKVNKKIILGGGILFGLAAVGYIFYYLSILNHPLFTLDPPLATGVIAINGHSIRVEIAATPTEQYSGLSNRSSLCADCGLLFNFTASEEREFVMRDMKFPLDMIFLNNGVIINIAANLAPEGNSPEHIYKSGAAANQVLEVNGGYCAAHNIRLDDKIQLNQ